MSAHSIHFNDSVVRLDVLMIENKGVMPTGD